MKNTWRLATSISGMNVNKKCINKILCSNIVYESVYEIAEVFNSYLSEINVALDKNFSTVDENPLDYLLIHNALSLFLKPIIPDECSKIIRALKAPK